MEICFKGVSGLAACHPHFYILFNEDTTRFTLQYSAMREFPLCVIGLIQNSGTYRTATANRLAILSPSLRKRVWGFKTSTLEICLYKLFMENIVRNHCY